MTDGPFWSPEPGKWAAPRDASWYDRPNVWSPKKVHVWGEDMMSACGRSILTDTLLMRLEEVPEHRRCRASGCREKWPALVA
ncbi:hypothetical protein [Microbispora sp. NPDC049125]|uniref:hypothetical protein n=1 Tax=Microbispora sp. NPDC049125 TaxID=3154929 RepID=UPI003466E055